MPTVTVPKSTLRSFNKLFTDEELNSLLFDFGLEVDEVTETEFKIEVPNNRHDLLCTNGIVQALQAYLDIKCYEDVDVRDAGLLVSADCKSRPFVACAVIQNIVLGQDGYGELIKYQEMLGTSLGKHRQIVAIGLHDFDTIAFPLRYTEVPPSEATFRPLGFDASVKGESMREALKDVPQGRYCSLLGDVYPVLLDRDGSILSLPPVINSEHSKISPATRNVFVDVTGTSFCKVNAALKHLLYNFRGEGVLSVTVNGKTTPVFSNLKFQFTVAEISAELGLRLTEEEACAYFRRMMHRASRDGPYIAVRVSDARSDVLHKVDLVEDIAIAHGFNNFERMLPAMPCVGAFLPVNAFVDKLRMECALLGFLEAQCLVLEQKTSPDQVHIASCRSAETQALRSSLLPGLLKSVSANLHAELPIRIFEAGDVVDGVENKRELCGVVAGKTAKIEEVQGALTQLLRKCHVVHEYKEEACSFYYPGRAGAAQVGGVCVAHFGIVSGDVCRLHRVPLACASFKVDKHAFLVAYNGKNYRGCQHNGDTETVEKAFVEGLVETGLIKACNGCPAKIGLQRCSRTDAGVHAAMNVFVAKTSEDPGDAEALRSVLAARDIHVYGAVRVSKHFNVMRACDSRVYEYFVPTFFLGGATHAEDLKNFAEGGDLDDVRAFRLGDVGGVAAVFKNYVGTREYHNFTTSKNERGTQRYIRAVDVDLVERDGIEYARVSLHGQGFLYNQVRKMVGHAVEHVRYAADGDFFRPFGAERTRVSTAPAQFLLLERPLFCAYNGSPRRVHAPIAVDEEALLSTKERIVYAEILRPENVCHFFQWAFRAACVALGVPLPIQARADAVSHEIGAMQRDALGVAEAAPHSPDDFGGPQAEHRDRGVVKREHGEGR
ncbi:UNVERIFIED_CONTAM: hypothetical protein PYX00_010902 [Menopon gallinae]|uniref:Phenylalanine--tRNA ligase beta subunit n=1 Tax=Menopon gallinae TaxID=328185 RepID=A0AAW2H6K0_9NEOP